MIFTLGKSRFRFMMKFSLYSKWKVVATFYLDNSYVTFKYFAFLIVCDKFELLGHVQAAMMI